MPQVFQQGSNCKLVATVDKRNYQFGDLLRDFQTALTLLLENSIFIAVVRGRIKKIKRQSFDIPMRYYPACLHNYIAIN